ncbi:hypothetical protein [Candidatus Poriferisocius sp.]|uniref:hypothetical protein n=1 Tax=Candidatus Poriferisocius sp. TaxID=3101276 RepID=UPI003B5AE04F
MAVTSVPKSWLREWRRAQLLSIFFASVVMMNGIWALVLWTPFDWYDAVIFTGPPVGSFVGVMAMSKKAALRHLQMFSDFGIEPESPETFVKSPRAIAWRRARARRTD